jgi:hypothetical protein
MIDEFIPLRHGIVEVLKNSAEAKVSDIEMKLRDFKVRITLITDADRPGYRITAAKGGLQDAKDAMKSLENSVVTRDHPIGDSCTRNF